MKSSTIKRQMSYLFLSNLAILFIGMGLFPILPVYAAERGASSSLVGIYLAITYVSITVGTLASGWLAEHLTHQRLFVGAGVLGVPALVLMGQATALWQVVALTSIVWFAGGIGLALVSVFTGLYADKESRGRSFSLLSIASPLGAVIGGLTVGRLIEWQGYAVMFLVLAAVWSVWPVLALFKVSYGVGATGVARTRTPKQATSATGGAPGALFYLVLVAALLAAMTVRVGRLGVSLSMRSNAFSAGAISSANVVAGLVTIPVALGFGSLSDRLGRKWFLTLGYLTAAAGVIALAAAQQLWHFWTAAALLLVAMTVNRSMASALTTDLLAPEALGRGLPLLSTTDWVAGVLGFAGAGYAIEAWGGSMVFHAVALFSVIGALLLAPLPGRRTRTAPAPAPLPEPSVAQCL